MDPRVIRALGLSCYEMIKRRISAREYWDILQETTLSLIMPGFDSWNCVNEWLRLEESDGVRSTWFVACRKGTGISYSTNKARNVVEKIRHGGHVVGLHSQCRGKMHELPNELNEFRSVYEIQGTVPVRFHYLLKPGDRIEAYEDLFEYSSSRYEERSFSSPDSFLRPINIMDTFLLSPIKQDLSFDRARSKTEQLASAAEKEGAQLVVDFHQRSLSKCFPRYREYILWFYDQMKHLD